MKQCLLDNQNALLLRPNVAHIQRCSKTAMAAIKTRIYVTKNSDFFSSGRNTRSVCTTCRAVKYVLAGFF